ncbi:MAG: DUF2269 family protein [Candidatus Eremiobacteraeota bacterium]|nr:DUF2269 family protein [Candidatus Eremiobacteraeota bacterium]
MVYLILKLVHVAGVVLFLGNITVGVFWKSYADRTGNAAIMASTMDGIIAADRVFTIPGIIILLIGGVGAALVGKIPFLSTGWLLWGIVAFILSGLAFGPLSRAQRKISVAAHAGNFEEYETLSKGWTLWGTIALLLPIVAFVLMILKPNLPAFHQ